MNINKVNIKHLNQWIWKWHFIAGIVLMPCILLLTFTGTLYLFKNIYETNTLKPMLYIKAQDKLTNKKLSYEMQLNEIKKQTKMSPNKLILSKNNNEASTFELGKWSKKRTVIINPYTKNIQGNFKVSDTLMHKIRKFHGELLLGKVGTKFVELTASWAIVLILTGLYIWWPKNKVQLQGIFLIRLNKGKRIFFRDLHVVSAFLLSIFLLITLAGGLPWTDVWGSGFKKIQQLTNSGYPKDYKGKNLVSDFKISNTRVSLDKVVKLANNLKLDGLVSITIPKNKKGVFSIQNKTQDITLEKMYHFDQYTLEKIKSFTWEDIGVMRKSRTWLMRFHQGLLASWNWYLMIIVSVLFLLSSIAGTISYVMRKEKNDFSIPNIPASFKFAYTIIGILTFLALFFPLFGLSVLLIIIFEIAKKYIYLRKKSKTANRRDA